MNKEALSDHLKIILSTVITSYLPRVKGILGNIGLGSWQYRPSAARSVQNDQRPTFHRMAWASDTHCGLVSTLLHWARVSKTKDTWTLLHMAKSNQERTMFRFPSTIIENMINCCNCIKLLSLTLRVNSLIFGPFISLSTQSGRPLTIFHWRRQPAKGTLTRKKINPLNFSYTTTLLRFWTLV